MKTKRLLSFLLLTGALLFQAGVTQGAVISASVLDSGFDDAGLSTANVSLGANEALVVFVNYSQVPDLTADPTVTFGASNFTQQIDNFQVIGGANVDNNIWAYTYVGSGTDTVTVNLNAPSGGDQYAYMLAKVSNVDTSNLIFSSGSEIVTGAGTPSADLGTLNADTYVLAFGFAMDGDNPTFTTSPSDLNALSSGEVVGQPGGDGNYVQGNLYGGTPGAGAYTADWSYDSPNFQHSSALAFSPIPEPGAGMLILGALSAVALLRPRR